MQTFIILILPINKKFCIIFEVKRLNHIKKLIQILAVFLFKKGFFFTFYYLNIFYILTILLILLVKLDYNIIIYFSKINMLCISIKKANLIDYTNNSKNYP